MPALCRISSEGSASSSSPEQLGWKPWIVVFTAALFFFYEFIQMTMFNSINTELRASFGITAVQLSNMSSRYFDANVLFLIPAGMLLDRFSTRRLILIAMSLCIASNFVFASTSSLLIAEICRFVTGMGSTFCLLSCVYLASRWFPPRRLALVSGLVVTMAMLGGTVGQAPFSILTQHFGWRSAVSISGVFGVIFLLMIFKNVVDFPPSVSAEYKNTHNKLHDIGFWKSLFLAVKNLQNWFAGIYTNILSLPVILLAALWVDPYLEKVHQLTATQASWVSTMIFIGTIFGSPIMGWFSDCVGKRKWPMIVGGFLSLITVMPIIEFPQLGFISLMVLFFLLGFFASSQVISYALIPESNSRVVTATALSLTATLIMSAGAIFQPLFGRLLDDRMTTTVVNGVKQFQYSAADYHHAMMIFPITFVVAIIMSFLVKETHCRFSGE